MGFLIASMPLGCSLMGWRGSGGGGAAIMYVQPSLFLVVFAFPALVSHTNPNPGGRLVVVTLPLSPSSLPSP